MAYTLIIHVAGEPAIAGEVEELPKPTDTIITISNPRMRDGKELHYLDHDVTRVIWPMGKISLIEILDTSEEEKVIGFVRE
jgi:hypothetical protein